MPIYDYLCSSCRHVTEVIHGINDPGPRFCPACGADGTMRKALVSPAIHFKGSGWAKKDRSSSTGTRAKSSTGASSDGAPGDAGSGDAGSGGGDSSDGSASTPRKPATESGTGLSAPSSASEG